MKKTILLILSAALVLPAAAQSWDQAQVLSENLYGGTARSIGMGNAVTAIGGDPGSIGINPAGGAVAGYTQFFISPGLSISSTSTMGYSDDGQDPLGFGNKVNAGYTRVKLPNVGFMLNMETGRKHGLKRVSFGFLANSTNDFTDKIKASGVLYGKNSYAGSLASMAQGYSVDALNNKDWWAEGPDWSTMAAYRSGIFDQYRDSYLAVTDMMVNGKTEAVKPLFQNYGCQSRGYKQDVVLNIAANWADKLYIGANFGVTTMSYTRNEFWEEMPADPATFPAIEFDDGATKATFNSLLVKNMYQVSGTGIYFKAGLLWRPVAGLRIGAAIQTPTIMSMTGRMAWSAETDFKGRYYSPAQSPEDEWIYSLVMPFRYNVGLAYSFGSFAVLSADYEMANYAQCRYGNRSEYGSDNTWLEYNTDIAAVLGISHYVRAGFEFKPSPELAIRVGYNFISTSQKNWLNADYSVTPLTKEERKLQSRNMVSFGAGYSFGSFYTDFAVRLRFLPDAYYVPYYKYAYENGRTVLDSEAEVPIIKSTDTGIDTVLTLGWRF